MFQFLMTCKYTIISNNFPNDFFDFYYKYFSTVSIHQNRIFPAMIKKRFLGPQSAAKEPSPIPI